MIDARGALGRGFRYGRNVSMAARYLFDPLHKDSVAFRRGIAGCGMQESDKDNAEPVRAKDTSPVREHGDQS